MVNEPSVFEPQRFYCINFKTNEYHGESNGVYLSLFHIFKRLIIDYLGSIVNASITHKKVDRFVNIYLGPVVQN